MKKLYYLIVLALILGLVLTGCTLLSNIGQVPTSEQSGVVYLTKNPSPPGLVALWHLDGNALDSSGNGNDGTLHNFVSPHGWVPGMFGQALSFDGNDDYVDCGSNVGNFDLSDPFTIEAWINPALDNTDDVIYGNAWAEPGYHVRVTSDNKVRFILITNGSNYNGIDSSELDTGWHHIAAVWDGTSVKIYIDGVDDSQTPIVGGTVTTITTVVNTKIGLDTAVHYFNGIIDEVRIWDKALQPEDILNPDISMEKSGPESAHADDIITYTYTVTNTGYVPLSDVTVSDDLAGDAEYVSGDTNGGGLLDLEETWIFTADYTVPEGVDPLENTATSSGTSPLDNVVVTADADWSVDILHPAISLVKSADTEVAAPDDTVTYTYTVTNVGDCTLYDVSLVDNVVGPIALLGLTDEDGDTFADDLAQGASATGSADYLVTIDDPEWLVNTAIASGSDELVKEVTATDTWSVHTMGARTIGYWKNHPDNWCAFPSGSMFVEEGPGTLLAYFPGNGIEEDGVNPLEMLRAQLIASELNYACFEDDFHYARYEAADIFGTMRDAEELLQRVYGAASGEDLNAFWSSLSKKQQKNVKQIANPIKDTLEEFNAMGDEIFE